MSEKPVVLITGDSDQAARIAAQLRHERAMYNVQVIGAAYGAGIPLEMAELMCMPLDDEQARRTLHPEPKKTQADLDRIAAAEEKRQRKAAKLIKQAA